MVHRISYGECICDLHLLTPGKMQCWAVRIHLELIKVPPQKKPEMACCFSLRRAIQGYSLISVSFPPTTRTVFFTPQSAHKQCSDLQTSSYSGVLLEVVEVVEDVVVLAGSPLTHCMEQRPPLEYFLPSVTNLRVKSDSRVEVTFTLRQ